MSVNVIRSSNVVSCFPLWIASTGKTGKGSLKQKFSLPKATSVFDFVLIPVVICVVCIYWDSEFDSFDSRFILLRLLHITTV